MAGPKDLAGLVQMAFDSFGTDLQAAGNGFGGQALTEQQADIFLARAQLCPAVLQGLVAAALLLALLPEDRLRKPGLALAQGPQGSGQMLQLIFAEHAPDAGGQQGIQGVIFQMGREQ